MGTSEHHLIGKVVGLNQGWLGPIKLEGKARQQKGENYA